METVFILTHTIWFISLILCLGLSFLSLFVFKRGLIGKLASLIFLTKTSLVWLLLRPKRFVFNRAVTVYGDNVALEFTQLGDFWDGLEIDDTPDLIVLVYIEGEVLQENNGLPFAEVCAKEKGDPTKFGAVVLPLTLKSFSTSLAKKLLVKNALVDYSSYKKRS